MAYGQSTSTATADAGYKYGIRMYNAFTPRLDMGVDQKNL